MDDASYRLSMIKLDIISDPICPWCYIGKAKLDAALAETGGAVFDINWRIFQLNPDIPAGGMDRTAYLERKFGGSEGAARVYGAIAAAGAEAGIEFRFELIRCTPNTFDAHRLIRWSRTTGNQSTVVAQLFARYFERGEDIGDLDLLKDIGVNAGMERDVLERLFDGDADAAGLRDEEAKIRQMGVRSVPTFVVAGRHALSGAQPAETWAQVIRELNAAAPPV